MSKMLNFLKKEEIYYSFIILLATRIALLLIAFMSHLVILKGDNYGEPYSFIDTFIRWDSNWYLDIVKQGYYFNPFEMSNIAFFPLYPLLIKTLSFIMSVNLAGFLISNIALLIGSIFLYKLVKFEFQDNKIAKLSVWFLMIFPASFFSSIIYTEGIFFGLAIPAFYFARRQKWLIASSLGFFLSLTKAIGFLFFIPLLIEFISAKYKEKSKDKKIIIKQSLILLIAPLGLLIFMGYCYLAFNDPIAFYHTQAGWNREFTYFTDTLLSLEQNRVYNSFYIIIYLGSTAFAVFMIFGMILSKLRISYITYSLSLLITFLSFKVIDSMERYIVAIFPMYIVMAVIAKENKVLEKIISFTSILLLALFIIMFVNGYWLI